MFRIDVKYDSEKKWQVVANIDNQIEAIKRFNEVGSLIWNNNYTKIEVALFHPNGNQMLHKNINCYQAIKQN